MLKFHDLQDALRKLLWERIDSGELTGMSLAEKTGFRQAHISNFLNRRRGLSLHAMDRVLTAEELSILDLIPADKINQRASIPPPREDEYANILLVDPRQAMSPQVFAGDVLEVIKFKESLLRRLRADATPDRELWVRFLMMRPTRDDCEAMHPRMAPGCTVLIDRHYNSLAPYRRREHTMFAVRYGDEVIIRYASMEGESLALQGQTHTSRLKMLHVPIEAQASDLILGRVAYVSMET